MYPPSSSSLYWDACLLVAYAIPSSIFRRSRQCSHCGLHQGIVQWTSKRGSVAHQHMNKSMSSVPVAPMTLRRLCASPVAIGPGQQIVMPTPLQGEKYVRQDCSGLFRLRNHRCMQELCLLSTIIWFVFWRMVTHRREESQSTTCHRLLWPARQSSRSGRTWRRNTAPGRATGCGPPCCIKQCTLVAETCTQRQYAFIS